ncbi:hypothetical protein JXC34_06935 [Candidatus Woesearchaeota archaeon]|nr:hypothetical protein [Candidatus Woesearchaeota archaeon]
MPLKKAMKKRSFGKHLLDLEILEKKYKINKKHLLLPLILVIFFIINRKYFMFGLLTILSGIFSFYHDRINRSPIDLKMPLVLGIIIARYYGVLFAVIFFVLSDLIPSILGGGEVEGRSLVFFAWTFAIYGAVTYFPQINIITLGIILVSIEVVGSLLINRLFGIPMFVSLFSSALSYLFRIVYFLTLGSFLEIILGGI